MRFVVWIVAVLAIAVAAGVGALGWVWFASEAHLKSFPPPPPFTRPIPTDAASLEHGRHLAVTRGCTSCHGKQLQGEVFHEGPYGERAVAPNLSKLARAESPGALERALRHGIGQDGRALYSMPSTNFARMSDTDVAALIGYLRTAPVVEAKLPRPGLGWRIRLALATGADAATPAFIGKVPPLTFQTDASPAVRRGEYLAMTSCNECHGFGLRGDDPFAPPGKAAPDLIIVPAAYDRAAFGQFMKTGKAGGTRELRMMSGVARARYSHWTEAEVDDLYAFFTALNAKALAE
jgi:cytochrome c553